MIARWPFDPIILLPYYPPGANDPNSPNYDPGAPLDGSANPPWWHLPLRPNLPFYPWKPDSPPPWMPRPMSAAAGPWEDSIMPAYPEDIGKDAMWEISLPPFKPVDHDLNRGAYDLIVELYDYQNNSSAFILPFIIDYPAQIPWFLYYGEDITIRDVKDENVTGWTLKLGEDEWDFTEDPENPGNWTLPSTVLTPPLPETPWLPDIMPAYPPEYEGDKLQEVQVGVHALPSWAGISSVLVASNSEKVYGEYNELQRLLLGAYIHVRACPQSADFYLEPVFPDNSTGTPISLGSAIGHNKRGWHYIGVNVSAITGAGTDFFKGNAYASATRRDGNSVSNPGTKSNVSFSAKGAAPQSFRKNLGYEDGTTYDDNIWNRALNNNVGPVNPAILKGLVAAESSFKSQAGNEEVGPKGLGQLYEKAWIEGLKGKGVAPGSPEYNEAQRQYHYPKGQDYGPWDPDANLKAAAGYLRINYDIADKYATDHTSAEDRDKLAVVGYRIGRVKLENALKQAAEKGEEITFDSVKDEVKAEDPEHADGAYAEANEVYKILKRRDMDPRQYDDEVEEENPGESEVRASAEEAQKETAKKGEPA